MTNNTIPNVSRELLERVKSLCEYWFVRGQQQHMSESEHKTWHALGFGSSAFTELRAHLSAPSPDGVDGLEVKRLSIAGVRSLIECSDGELARYSDVERLLAIIDGLRGDVAQLQSMLATVSKAGIRVRTERDQQAQRICELEGLLRDSAELIKHGVFEDGICCCGASVDSHGFGDGHSPVDALAYHAGQVCERINAALSAGKEKQDERS